MGLKSRLMHRHEQERIVLPKGDCKRNAKKKEAIKKTSKKGQKK